MGRALKDTKVKVSGMNGPLKKGLPLSTVIGQGGLYGLYMGRPITPRIKVPGFKSLLKKRATRVDLKNPPGTYPLEPSSWSSPAHTSTGNLSASG